MKFDPRAKICVFVGYPTGVKRYKLYDIQNKNFFFSRDVVFHEDVFPFKSLPSSQQPLDPFSQVVLPIPTADLIPSPSISLPPSSTTSPADFHSPSPPSHNSQNLTLRRSTRLTKPPSYLKDFHCHFLNHHSNPSFTNSHHPYPLSNHLQYNSLSLPYKHFIMSISSNSEPRSYHQAIHHQHWKDAMTAELSAMETNNTWSVVPLPSGKYSISCKWIYKIKYRSDGSIDRYKARLVAKGYNQTEGVDFTDTYSPVAKFVTIKVLLTLAIKSNWHLTQLDVNNAFLHGDLNEEVYMDLPLGYGSKQQHHSSNRPLVCKLHKSIYGLKQASRQWYSKLTQALLHFGFTQSKSNYSLFTRGSGATFIALLVYVDDIALTGPSLDIL